MLTEEQIKEAAFLTYDAHFKQAAFRTGATWANDQNAAEMSQLLEVLAELLKGEYRLPDTFDPVIGRAKELLSKYGK